MKHAWLKQGTSDCLFVFFAGWGMDSQPFEYLDARKMDVLMLYDYRDLSCPDVLRQALDRYVDRSLLAWSLGVAVANLVCQDLAGRFELRTALNGTVCPVDPEEGIAPERFDATIDQLDQGGLARFIRRTCVRREIQERYLQRPAQRSLPDLREELRVLRHIDVVNACIFDKAMVGSEDRIFLPGNQVRCWNRRGVSCWSLDAPHFPFYRWNTWEEVRCACRGC
jgi:hypothetical protein